MKHPFVPKLLMYPWITSPGLIHPIPYLIILFAELGSSLANCEDVPF
jgi:hypothetical protein